MRRFFPEERRCIYTMGERYFYPRQRRIEIKDRGREREGTFINGFRNQLQMRFYVEFLINFRELIEQAGDLI